MPNNSLTLEFLRICAEWRLLLRAAGYLLIVGVICGVALYENRPSAKTVKLDAACSEVTVPATFTANLSSADALFDSVQLWGFDGEISKLKQVQRRKNKEIVSAPWTDPIPLQAPPSAATLPYLRIQPGTKYGSIGMTLARGVTLRPGDLPGDGPRLHATSARGGDMLMYLESDK